MKTLTRYIGREVLYGTLLIFVGLLSLFALFDLIHELGNVGRDGYPLGRALLFVGLSIPGHVYELVPTAALIGTLFAISQMVANSEYTVMRASGASLTQITLAIVRVGVPLAIATFLAGEFLAPPAERLAQTVRVQNQGNANRIVAQQFDSGFWFRQDLPVSTFVNIKSLVSDSGETKLLGVRMYEFDRDLRLTSLRVADSGTFVSDGLWRLKNVKTTALGPGGATVTRVDQLDWETVLKPSILTVYQVAPEKLELGTLYDNIRVLGHNQQKTSRFEIAFWNKLFYPAAVIVMMVLAIPFAYFQRRAGGMGFRIFVGTILGLVFFLIGRLFAYIGVINDWPPLFSAAFPVCAFVAVAGSMLWWLERR
ncbi:MAG TPA: LPS export ABC transporter permease LptG [Casimicrobiaceae bacterium]|nr:LPS export ABC transporter permease LptG [Casimicrobiaceae bacterium]